MDNQAEIKEIRELTKKDWEDAKADILHFFSKEELLQMNTRQFLCLRHNYGDVKDKFISDYSKKLDYFFHDTEVDLSIGHINKLYVVYNGINYNYDIGRMLFKTTYKKYDTYYHKKYEFIQIGQDVLSGFIPVSDSWSNKIIHPHYDTYAFLFSGCRDLMEYFGVHTAIRIYKNTDGELYMQTFNCYNTFNTPINKILRTEENFRRQPHSSIYTVLDGMKKAKADEIFITEQYERREDIVYFYRQSVNCNTLIVRLNNHYNTRSNDWGERWYFRNI